MLKSPSKREVGKKRVSPRIKPKTKKLRIIKLPFIVNLKLLISDFELKY